MAEHEIVSIALIVINLLNTNGSKARSIFCLILRLHIGSYIILGYYEILKVVTTAFRLPIAIARWLQTFRAINFFG